MKIKQGFKIKTECGQTIVVCDKKIDPSFNSSIILTETSTFLWNLMQNGCTTKEALLNGLLKEFDISTVLALSNIDIFIRILKENGILEE